MVVKNVEIPNLKGEDPMKVLAELAERNIFVIYNTAKTVRALYERVNRDASEIDPDDYWRMRPLSSVIKKHNKGKLEIMALYDRLQRDSYKGWVVEFVTEEVE